MEMQPLYISNERFGPWLGQRWSEYVEWSGLTQLEELVTLDGMLCAPILEEIKDEYWPQIVNEDFMLNYFINLNYLLTQVAETTDKNILCVFRNPSSQPIPPSDILHFEFLGYDLVDVHSSASALSNCGGFPKAFSNKEINKFGLLGTHGRAAQVQTSLRAFYPKEHHANCHVWALFRADDN